jgi:hypothetical protein
MQYTVTEGREECVWKYGTDKLGIQYALSLERHSIGSFMAHDSFRL